MRVNPILLFGLGSQGTAIAKALQMAYKEKFPDLTVLMDGLCLDAEGKLSRIKECGRDSVQVCFDFQNDLVPGVFSCNRITAKKGLQANWEAVNHELNELFSSLSELETGEMEYSNTPTVVVLAPAGDPVGSAILYPFLQTLSSFLNERLRQMTIPRHLVVLLPELFPETQASKIADARCYTFFQELEYVHSRPLVVFGTMEEPVDFNWVLGRRTETGYDLVTLENVARHSVEFLAYLAWGHLNLEHGRAALNNTVNERRAAYSVFGSARLVYPTDNVETAVRGRVESDLLEELYPDIINAPDLEFSRAEIVNLARHFIRDNGIDQVMYELFRDADGSPINVTLSVPGVRNLECSAESFVQQFNDAMENAESTGFGDAETRITTKTDATFGNHRDKIETLCTAIVDDPKKGTKYARALMSALVQADIPYTRDESLQERLSLRDVDVSLKSEFEQRFAVDEGKRRKLLVVKRDREKKNEHRARLIDRQLRFGTNEHALPIVIKELEELDAQIKEIEESLQPAESVMEDQVKREAAFGEAVKGKKEEMEKAGDALKTAHERYIKAKSSWKNYRTATILSWCILALVYLAGLAFSALVSRHGGMGFVRWVGMWPLLVALIPIDCAIGCVASYRRAGKRRDSAAAEKQRLMNQMVIQGQAYLDALLSHAVISHALYGVVDKLIQDVEARLIPSLDKSLELIGARHEAAVNDISAVKEKDTHLEKFVVNQKDLEHYFSHAEERLEAERKAFRDAHAASGVFADLMHGRTPRWDTDVLAFCSNVFSSLLGKSIQDVFRESDLVRKEMFVSKFQQFQYSLSAFVGLDQMASQGPSVLHFVGARDTNDLELKDLVGKEGGFPPQSFSLDDDRVIVSFIVKMGVPAFQVSAILPGAKVLGEYRREDLSADLGIKQVDIERPNFGVSTELDHDFYLWAMAKAFDLWHPDAMGQGIGDIDSEFQSFTAGLTNVQRAELGSRLDEALKDDAATGILMSKLQENNDQRVEAILHNVVEMLAVEGHSGRGPILVTPSNLGDGVAKEVASSGDDSFVADGSTDE